MRFARRTAWIAFVALSLAGCTPGSRPGGDPGVISAAGRAALATADSLTRAGAPAPARDVLRAHAERCERERLSPLEQAETMLRLGRVEIDLGDLTGAMPHLARAIEQARAAGPAHRLLEAEARNVWGTGAKNQGRYEEARHSHETAAEIARSLGDAGRMEVASALAGVGAILRREPTLRDSTALLQGQALAIMRAVEGDTSLAVARMRVGYALVLAQLERIDEARGQVEAARPIITAQLGPDHSSVAFASSLAGWLAYRAGDLPAAQHALEQTLESNARARLKAQPGSDRLRFRPKPADALAAVHLAAGRPDAAWDVLDAAQSLLFHEAITGAGADSVHSVNVPPHTRAAVQATLDAETAILGWLDVSLVEESPIESWAYVLRDRGPVRWIRLEAPGPRGPGDFVLFRQRLEAAFAWPGRVETSPEIVAAAQAAWRERFARVEPALVGVRHLVIVLSPGIAAVPIDALIDDRGTALVDRFTVSYIHSPSTRVDMVRRAAATPRAPRPTALFIDGDLLSEGKRAAGRIGTFAHFAAATRIAPGRGAEAAVREAWAADGGQAPLHFVQFDGHAMFEPRVPGASALVLDGRGRGMQALKTAQSGRDEFVDAPDDGLLSVAEIERLRLPADLVVLAACRSAGGFAYGGFMGIGDAFLRAGANSVLSSLWSVDERATVELLRRFCARAYGPDGTMRVPPAEALRLARQEVRAYTAPDGTHPFAHPVYWAPFVLVGEAEGGR